MNCTKSCCSILCRDYLAFLYLMVFRRSAGPRYYSRQRRQAPWTLRWNFFWLLTRTPVGAEFSPYLPIEHVARNALAVPASSGPPERVFSQSRLLVMTWRCNRMPWNPHVRQGLLGAVWGICSKPTHNDRVTVMSSSSWDRELNICRKKLSMRCSWQWSTSYLCCYGLL